MLAAGCGSLAAHFSSSFSTATARWDLDDAQTPMGITYGQSALSCESHEWERACRLFANRVVGV